MGILEHHCLVRFPQELKHIVPRWQPLRTLLLLDVDVFRTLIIVKTIYYIIIL